MYAGVEVFDIGQGCDLDWGEGREALGSGVGVVGWVLGFLCCVSEHGFPVGDKGVRMWEKVVDGQEQNLHDLGYG